MITWYTKPFLEAASLLIITGGVASGFHFVLQCCDRDHFPQTLHFCY